MNVPAALNFCAGLVVEHGDCTLRQMLFIACHTADGKHTHSLAEKIVIHYVINVDDPYLCYDWALDCSDDMAVEFVFNKVVHDIDAFRSKVDLLFKIGIASDLCNRLYHEKYGYVTKGLTMNGDAIEKLHPFWASTPAKAALLERRLITYYQAVHYSGCLNSRPGGDTCPHVGPVFVYFVWKRRNVI